MLAFSDMTNALVDTFQQIPEIGPFLLNGDMTRIVPYIDLNPTKQSLETAGYAMPDGSILVGYRESEFDTGEEMSMWMHRFEVYLRSSIGTSVQDMATALINGVPSGQNLRWRLLQLFPELYSTNVTAVTRQSDSQNINFFLLAVELKETGDA